MAFHIWSCPGDINSFSTESNGDWIQKLKDKKKALGYTSSMERDGESAQDGYSIKPPTSVWAQVRPLGWHPDLLGL